MPRMKPNTQWDNEPEPNTQWKSDRGIGYLLTEFFGFLLLENGGKIILDESIATKYIRPRFGGDLENMPAIDFADNLGNNILNNSGITISLSQGYDGNIITTGWI